MRAAVRHALVAALALFVAMMGTGCGSERPSDSPGVTSDAPGDRAAAQPTDDSDTGGTDVDADADGDAPPSPEGIVKGGGLLRLARAYAPVSERINFLVAAETLRVDAVEAKAGDAVERERAGVVRIEARRMQDVLAAARPKVASVPVRTVAQQQVQQLLLEAIDVRSRAVRELVTAILARGTGQGDSVVEKRFATWRTSWDESLRSTREATTTTQDALTGLGLAPLREEALR